MKAVVKTKRAPGITVQDVPVPVVGEADILVKVKAASLCGSDVHVYEWTPNYEWLPVPVILGHEFAGAVVETGRKVRTVSAGDRITAMPAMACGQCDYCQVGKPDLCPDRISLGLRGNGAFAEYVRLTAAATIFKLPDSLGFEPASLCEPLAVVLRAVDISDIKVGQTAAVLGPGPIGLLTLQVVRLSGASSVMVAGTGADKKRLDIALELGADRTINVDREDPVSVIPAGGFDCVFEASGSPRSVPQALAMVKPGGRVILIGIHPAPAEIQTTDLVRRSKSVLGAYGYDAAIWRRAIALLTSRRVVVEPLVTHRLPLAEAEKGFELAVQKVATKVLFMP